MTEGPLTLLNLLAESKNYITVQSIILISIFWLECITEQVLLI